MGMDLQVKSALSSVLITVVLTTAVAAALTKPCKHMPGALVEM